MATYQEEERFLHLVRLAWDLRCLGLAVTLELPFGGEPLVIVRRASDPLRVRASLVGQRWIFTWGRGRKQRVEALDEHAANKIGRAAR